VTQKLEKRLRFAAGKATPWDEDDDHAASISWKENKGNNAKFCRIANPENIIELLDELGEQRKLIKELKATR